jgi:hypothetical protein
VTTNAVSKIVHIPTSAAVEAFFIARMTHYPSSTVRLPANARHLVRTAAQFCETRVNIRNIFYIIGVIVVIVVVLKVLHLF